MFTQMVAYIAVASLLVVLAAAATLRIGLLRLESKLGVGRDGLSEGTRAPAWRLRDADGVARRSPNPNAWQLLVFSDHSLKEFPRLAFGLGELAAQEEAAEVLLLARHDSDLKIEATQIVLEGFDLDIPIIPVGQKLYWKYNIRVLPFLVIVDPDGIVRASGLVNEETHLMSMWRFSRLLGAPKAAAVEV
jgi:hypothetical protein